MIKKITYILSSLCLLASCQEKDGILSDIFGTDKPVINVGGVTTDDLTIALGSGTSRATVGCKDGKSRAVDGTTGATSIVPEGAAEKQLWLIPPLKSGLDITYGKVGDVANTSKVAILKLQSEKTEDSHYEFKPGGDESLKYIIDKDSYLAVYTFKYREDSGEGEDACWYDNGEHFFEGQYVPQQLRYGAGAENGNMSADDVNTKTAPELHTSQKSPGTAGSQPDNYTLLEQYLGMPANTNLSATVSRINLPFRHRLCRVMAIILIDPSLGQGVTLKGYKSTEAEKTDPRSSTGWDDPETTKLMFGNVEVLSGVKDEVQNGHHTLTPKWIKKRSVIPHFIGEYASVSSEGELMDPDFIAYQDLSDDSFSFPSNTDWKDKHKKYHDAEEKYGKGNINEIEKATGLREINYGQVPVYDIIVRPTYSKLDNVMYDEEGVKKADGTEDATIKKAFYEKKNKIDFDMTLNNGLQYAKTFEFDLDANYQTVVYLRVSPEKVDYNSSGAEIWVEQKRYDDWYGVNNEGGHSLSPAGSSWQRAYTCGTTVSGDKVTDGDVYNEQTTGNTTGGQYLTDATWIKYFSQAHEGGAHHGDYFILHKDLTIKASDLPEDFVFTGHLDAQGHTITFQGASAMVYDVTTNYNLPVEQYYWKNGATYEQLTLPTVPLYFSEEIAQAKPIVGGFRSRSAIGSRSDNDDRPSIPGGEDLMTKIENITVAQLMDGTEYYTYDAQNRVYTPYTTPAALYLARQGSAALFCGLNGNYTTAQEKNPSLPAAQWEANVHKDRNNSKNYWVPYKTDKNGWRAEVLNLRVSGSLFKQDAIITGNVQNCYEGNVRYNDIIPELPKY